VPIWSPVCVGFSAAINCDPDRNIAASVADNLIESSLTGAPAGGLFNFQFFLTGSQSCVVLQSSYRSMRFAYATAILPLKNRHRPYIAGCTWAVPLQKYMPYNPPKFAGNLLILG
jgi:hypothetical protein